VTAQLTNSDVERRKKTPTLAVARKHRKRRGFSTRLKHPHASLRGITQANEHATWERRRRGALKKSCRMREGNNRGIDKKKKAWAGKSSIPLPKVKGSRETARREKESGKEATSQRLGGEGAGGKSKNWGPSGDMYSRGKRPVLRGK